MITYIHSTFNIVRYLPQGCKYGMGFYKQKSIDVKKQNIVSITSEGFTPLLILTWFWEQLRIMLGPFKSPHHNCTTFITFKVKQSREKCGELFRNINN